MNILSMSKMVFSSEGAWAKLDRKHPPLLKLYALVVLPLSILPPVIPFGRHSSIGIGYYVPGFH